MLTRTRGRVSLLTVVWLIVGLVVAWRYGYLGMGFLGKLLSAVLAVILWPLALLGVNLQVG